VAGEDLELARMRPDYERIEQLERRLFPEMFRWRVTERDRAIARALLAIRRSPATTHEED
jgi:hypothetical protein